jgi:RHS repeat-associated protein
VEVFSALLPLNSFISQGDRMANVRLAMLKIAGILAVVLSVSSLSCGQIMSVTADQAPPIPHAGHDFIQAMNETVSPATGAVDIHIDVDVPPGREIDVPFAFGYDSNGANHFADGGAPVDNTSYLAQGGWRYVVPLLQYSPSSVPIIGTPGNGIIAWCNSVSNYTMTDLEGTMHPLGINLSPLGWQNCTGPGLTWPSSILQNTDGVVTATTTGVSGASSPTPFVQPVTVLDHDGTMYSFPNAVLRTHLRGQWAPQPSLLQTAAWETPPSGLPDFIETRNGNRVQFIDDGAPSGAFHIMDTLGRNVISTSSFGSPSGDTVSVSGLSQPYRLTWGTASYNWNVGAQFVVPPLSQFWFCGGFRGPATGSIPVVTSIALPNGLSYQFQYESQYGMLSKIIYPNGAYVRYVWGTNPASTEVLYGPTNQNPTGWNNTPPPGAAADCEAIYDSPAIMQRFVSFDGVNEVQEQDFHYATTWAFTQNAVNRPYQAWTQKTTTVTTRDLVTGANFQTIYTYQPLRDQVLGNDNGTRIGGTGVILAHPGEKMIQYFGTDGALLKTVQKTYVFDYWAPKEVMTSVNGLSSLVHTDYQKDAIGLYEALPIVTDQYEYDFGNTVTESASVTNPAPLGPHGSLLRHVHTDYHVFPPGPLSPPANLNNGFNTTIIDRPSAVITYDGFGNRFAETDFGYDEAAVSPALDANGNPLTVSIPGRDENNYNAGFTGPRGNTTTETHRCFVPATGAGCQDSVVHYTFDQTGQVMTKTDGNGNTTTYNYADNFTEGGPVPGATDAFLTRITHPVTSVNGVSHIQSFTYAYQDGQLTSSTDENRNQTTYTYNDPFRRLTQIDLPGRGQKTMAYNDAGSQPTVVTTTKTNTDGSNPYISTVVKDAMGHTIQTQVNSDPDGVDVTDTVYDGMGRPIRVSNPHRTTAAATDGFTQTQYDALGRVTQITEADNSFTQTNYANFPAVTVTDEAGNQRISRTDGLGRLIEVDEPGLPAGTATLATTASGWATVAGAEQSVVTGVATPGTGSGTVSGTEQSVTGPSSVASGSVDITGSDQTYQYYVQQTCQTTDPDGTPETYDCSYWTTAYDTGGLYLTINGYTTWMGYNQYSTAAAIAWWFAYNLNADPNSPVTASSNGTTIYFTSKTGGAASNYAVTTSSYSDGGNVSPPSFGFSSSAFNLSGGADGVVTYDSGSVWISINGFPFPASYGQGDTAATVAAKLQTALGPSMVTAKASGSTITLTAKRGGGDTNYKIAGGSSTSLPGTFSQPSFTVSVSGPTLTGGHDAGVTYDKGSVWVVLNQNSYSVNYGQGDTVATIVSALKTKLGAAPVNVSTSPDGLTIVLTANQPGPGGNYSLSAGGSSSQPPGVFPHPSFTANVSGTSMVGGNNAGLPSLSTPAVTLYSYDALGNLLHVEQHGNDPDPANWRQRNFSFDSLSHPLTATSPESGTICYGTWQGNQCVNGYDANGNLVAKTAPAPDQTGGATVTTYFSYDELNRLKTRWFSDGSHSASFFYDQSSIWGVNVQNPVGRLVATYAVLGNYTTLNGSSGGGGVGSVFSYDPMGRVTQDVQFNQHVLPWLPFRTFNYTYNLDGSLNTMQYPSGRLLTYSYNAARQTTSVADSSGITFAADAHYFASGALGYVVNGGVTLTENYNVRMQPNEIHAAVGTNPPLLDLVYDYTLCNSNHADDGNVCRITNNKDVSRSEYFQYDALNRLTAANSSNWSQTYGYDNWGNLLAKTAVGGDTALSADVNGRNQVIKWCYDAAGNIVASQYCTGYANNAFPNVFNAENQLIRSTAAGATTAYDYDVSGLRVQKLDANSSGRLYWYGAGGQVLEETDLNGSLQNDYIYFNGKRIARVGPTTVPDCAPPGPGGTAASCPAAATPIAYYFSDALGSANLVADANGAVQEDRDFYPFGAERIVADLGIGNNYKFTGKERDPETGLDYFGARYYGSAIGRFLQVDPAFESEMLDDPQTWNRYSYVYNQPTRLTDPDGRCPPCIAGAVGFVAGGLVEGGINLVTQLAGNGWNIHDVSWGQVGAHAAGGAVTGGLAGLTLGGSLSPSLMAEVGVGVVSNVAGGVVERSIEKYVVDDPDAPDPLDGNEVAVDAVSGAVGGVVSHYASELVHVKNPGTPPPRWTPRYNAKMERYMANLSVAQRAALKGFALGAAIFPGANWATHRAFDALMWLAEPDWERNPQLRDKPKKRGPHSDSFIFNCHTETGEPCLY